MSPVLFFFGLTVYGRLFIFLPYGDSYPGSPPVGGDVFTTIKNSVVISKGNERIQANQLETLTKVLITQASLSASSMIADQDQERLLALTNQLAQERLVFDATIYDSEG